MEYTLLSEKDWDDVKPLIIDSFLAREPTSLALYFKPAEVLNLFSFVADMCIKSDCSYGSWDRDTGKLVGFMLNRISLLEHQEMEKNMKWDGTPQETLYEKLFEYAYKGIDMFKQNEGVDRIFYFFALTVHPNYKGKGIARKLVEISELKGIEEGCQLGKVEASNIITQHIWGKLGYKTFAKLVFKEYNKEKGEDVFDLDAAAPTKGWHCMSKRLDGN